MHQPVDGGEGHGLAGEHGVPLSKQMVGRDEK